MNAIDPNCELICPSLPPYSLQEFPAPSQDRTNSRVPGTSTPTNCHSTHARIWAANENEESTSPSSTSPNPAKRTELPLVDDLRDGILSSESVLIPPLSPTFLDTRYPLRRGYESARASFTDPPCMDPLVVFGKRCRLGSVMIRNRAHIS